MPRVYRLAVIALGLMLFAFQARSQEADEMAFEDQPVAEDGQLDRAFSGKEVAVPERQDTSVFVPAIQGIEAAIRDLVAAQNPRKDADEIQRQKDDLNAQMRMALWAMWMFFAAIGSLFLTGAGVLLIWRTLHHTRRAADYTREMVDEARAATAAAEDTAAVAKQAMIAEKRAWLTLEKVNLKAITQIHTEGGQFSIEAIVKNIGMTPATSVWVKALTCPPYDPNNGIPQFYREFIESVRSTPKDWGYVVFPQERDVANIVFPIQKSDVDAALVRPRAAQIGVSFRMLVGVGYRIIGDDKPHVTIRTFTTHLMALNSQIADGKKFALTPEPILPGEAD